MVSCFGVVVCVSVSSGLLLLLRNLLYSEVLILVMVVMWGWL